MRTIKILSVVVLAGICLVIVYACSSRGGNSPVSPSLTGNQVEYSYHPSDLLTNFDPLANKGPNAALPPLGWAFVEPVELAAEGWRDWPATTATSMTVTAILYGTRAEGFDGDVILTVDAEDHPFTFVDNILTAHVSGLGRGHHQFHVNAGCRGAWASRSLEFDIITEPPYMQVGVGTEDGMLYAIFDRRLPPILLGNLSAWELVGFPCYPTNVNVLPDNSTVVIELSSPLRAGDRSWFPEGSIPEVRFHSPLGVSIALMAPSNNCGISGSIVMGGGR